MRKRGFTLIELLVVISIIGILMGLAFTGITEIRKHAQRQRCYQEMTNLEQMCKFYEQMNGDYPPSRLEDLFPGSFADNPVNEGIETMLIAILNKKHPANIPEDKLINTDRDRAGGEDLEWIFNTDELYEYADPWGNPYVYIHYRNYDAPAVEYRPARGDIQTVTAIQSPKTGTYFNPTSFQIWSFGPNGINEHGEGDDLCLWGKP